MKITEALKNLENTWSREDNLVKIKNGINSEKILNDFFNNNIEEIEVLFNYIKPKDFALLNEIEELSNIESKLIKKIKSHSLNQSKLTKFEEYQKTDLLPHKNNSFNLGLFMMKWSNKFVFISLLVISAVALTKQAWA